jgi:hypothetical protein
MSADVPAPRLNPKCHRIETAAGTFAVICWYYAARGPLSKSVGQAISRWQHSAERTGAPAW